MIFSKCKNCAHWTSPDKGWGTCQIGEGNGGGPLHADSLAYARDDDLWKPVLITHENFGCVQWKGKPRIEKPPEYPNCQAGRDGDCIWTHCPQERDNEPHKTGRSCPLEKYEDYE